MFFSSLLDADGKVRTAILTEAAADTILLSHRLGFLIFPSLKNMLRAEFNTDTAFFAALFCDGHSKALLPHHVGPPYLGSNKLFSYHKNLFDNILRYPCAALYSMFSEINK
jgi:hypothetical protein